MAEAKSKGGRPPHLPTAQQRWQVEVLKGCGWKDEIIAKFFGIARSTLRIAYKNELKSGRDKLGCLLSVTLVQQALKGKLPAIFFTLKTQFGWRENVGLQAIGKDGEPIDLNRLDTASLEQLFTALTAGAAGAGNTRFADPEEDDWQVRSMVSAPRTTN